MKIERESAGNFLFLPLFFVTSINSYTFVIYSHMDKHKNKLMWQSDFFIFRRLKNNITCFFYKKCFDKQHQAEI